MNLRLIPGALALILCASATVAHASPITYDPSPNPFLDHPSGACSGNTAGPCYSYELNFALPAFDPALDQLLSANLTLMFYDDADARTESVNVTLDGVLAGEYGIASNSTQLNAFTTSPINVLSQMQADGLLNVLLQVGSTNQGNNDFYFESATLVAMWERLPVQGEVPTVPAPEPVELALFGLALSAFAFRLRRRK